jgi:hypothetical protein
MGQEVAEKAASAAAFVHSIGVAAHWGYSDTPYGFAYDMVKARLRESGIRHVRDGFFRPIEVQRIEELGRLGISHCVIAEPEVGTPTEIQQKVKTINARVPGAIDVLEGPNEPDLFWAKNKKVYGGKSGANGPNEAIEAAVLFFRETVAAFRADPATRSIKIMGIALGKTYEPGKNPLPPGSLTEIVDWGNVHPYFGGNPFSNPFRYGTLEKFYWHGTHPGTNIDEFPYAFRTYHPPYAPKPMAASEAGCATDTNGTSETAHGKYIPRMFLEYFRKGFARTYSYEFLDEFTNPHDREARFGLLRRDLTPKPAFTALKNLITLLEDTQKGSSLPLGALKYSLKVEPVGEWNKLQYVHHLLLQKSNGKFYLIVWHEVSCEDGSTKPRRQFTVPPLPATLKVRGSVRLHQWSEDGTVSEQRLTASEGAYSFPVTDHVTVLEITP